MELNNQNSPIQPTAPELPKPPTAKKWYQHKGIITIIVLAILVAIVSWIYFANQPAQDISPIVVQHKVQQLLATSTPQQTPTSTPAQTDISNWKTYKNDQLGFSFQYPADTSISTTTFSSDVDNSVGVDVALTYNDRIENNPYIGTVAATVGFEVKVSPTKFTDINEWLKSYYQDKDQTEQTPTQIDGVTAVSVNEIVTEGGCDSDYTAVINNNLVYQIIPCLTSDASDPNQSIFNSFKFTSITQLTGFLSSGKIVDCSQHVNFDPANTTVTYSNPQKGLSFQVPFNSNWGNASIKLSPYEELSDHIVFGNLMAGEGCGYKRETYMYFDQTQSASAVIAQIKQDPNYQYFTTQATQTTYNGLTLINYEGTDMCTKPTVIVIGTKFNYRFTYDCGGDASALESVAKTLKLLP